MSDIAQDPGPASQAPGANQPPLEARLVIDHANLTNELDLIRAEVAKIEAITNDAESEAAAGLQTRITRLERDITLAHTAEKAEAAKITTTVDMFFLSRGLKGQTAAQKEAVARKLGAYLAKKAEERRQAELAEAKRLKEEADKLAAEAAAKEDAGSNTVADVVMNAALATDKAAKRHEAHAAAPTAELARTYSTAGTTSLRQSLGVDIARATIDLEALRPYLDLEAIKTAIGQWARAEGVTVAKVQDGTEPKLKGVTFRIESKAGTR